MTWKRETLQRHVSTKILLFFYGDRCFQIAGILVPMRRMQMTYVEYLLLMAIVFFDPGR